MLRSGRFRHRLLDETFLLEQSSQAQLSLQPFLRLWEDKFITDRDIVAIYLCLFSFLRRPKDFLGGPHQVFEVNPPQPNSAFTCQNFLELLIPTLPQELQSRKSLHHFQRTEALVSFVCRKSFRSIPASVMRSLWRWQMGTYSLKLLTHVPHPAEVLDLQCQGQRCVSMLVSSQEIRTLVEDGRDVLGFIVHDLIHADHFFQDPNNARAQVQFSQKLQNLWQQIFLQELIATDLKFKSEFFYLMSDMNSVPLHLLKSLKTTFLAYCKRRHKIPMQQKLPSDLESHFLELFQRALAPWDFSSEGLKAAHRLNTPAFVHPQDSLLLHSEMTKFSRSSEVASEVEDASVFCSSTLQN